MAYMDDVKPNSNKYKEEQQERRKLTPVVSGKTTSRKEGIGRKFAETFLSDDIHDVKRYIIQDVLIPSIRDGIYEMFTGGMSMLFYGDSRSPRSKGVIKRSGTKTDYNGISSNRHAASRANIERCAYNDIIFDDRADAIEVRDQLQDLVDQYEIAYVADFYELSGYEFNTQHEKYGWTDLDNVQVLRDRDGYRLSLPKAVPIK